MAVNQLKAGAILNYIILGLNALSGLIYMPYMLRMLGQSEYGIYSLAASVIAYLSMLDFGFGHAVIRYTAKFRAENKTEQQYSMFGMFTVLYSVIGVIAFCAGLVLYFNTEAIFGETLTQVELERTKVIILLMIINLAVTFPLSIYGAIVTAYERFIFLRAVQILRILLSTLVMIVLLNYGYKAITLVVVQTVFNFITLGLNYFYCRKKIKINIRFKNFDTRLLKEVVIFSFWIFLNIIMDKVYWSTGQFILGAVVGTAAIAVFAVAIQLETIYMAFSTAISGVLLPRVTALVSQGDNKKEISDLFIKTGRIQFIVMSFILSGFILFGRPFVVLWAGPEYEDVYFITLLFFGALLVPLIQNVGISILQARNQLRFRSLLYVSIAVVSLIAQVMLAKKYGGIGCAIAISAALLLGQGLIMNVYYYKVQNINILKFWKEIIRMSMMPVILVSAGLFYMKSNDIETVPRLIIHILVFTILYILFFWKFSMNDYERDICRRPFAKIKNKLREFL